MKYRIVSLGLSLALYGIALAIPCLLFKIVPINTLKVPNPKDYEVEMNGFELTLGGIFGLMFLQIAAVGWLANPIYWLCCAFFARQKYKISAIAALTSVAVGFGGTLLGFWFKLPSGTGAPPNMLLEKLLAGFWVWLSAPGLLALISIFYLVKTPRIRQS
jgi:hypothetical protein